MPSQSDSRGDVDIRSLFAPYFHALTYEREFMTYCSIEAFPATAKKWYRSSTHTTVDVASFQTELACTLFNDTGPIDS